MDASQFLDNYWGPAEPTTEKVATPTPPAAAPDLDLQHVVELATFAKEAGAVLAARLGQQAPDAEPITTPPASDALSFVQQKLAATGFNPPQGGTAPARTDMPGQADFPGGVRTQLGTTEAAIDFTRREAKEYSAKELQELIGQRPPKDPEVRRDLATSPEKGGLKYATSVGLVQQMLRGEA